MFGTFIALEGGEGVGKTTQMSLLKQRLPELYPEREFIFTREPGGSPLAERIRSVIMDSPDADGKTMFGLFAAARYDHLNRTVVPNLENGKIVVTDRFVAATYAYQACAMENPISLDLFLEYYNSLFIVPSVTIILDLDPEISQERVRARTRRFEDTTHFDTRPPEFHNRLRDGYLQLPRLNLPRGKFLVVDAGRSVEEVRADILKMIDTVL